MNCSTKNWKDKGHDFFWMSSSAGKGAMRRPHVMSEIPV